MTCFVNTDVSSICKYMHDLSLSLSLSVWYFHPSKTQTAFSPARTLMLTGWQSASLCVCMCVCECFILVELLGIKKSSQWCTSGLTVWGSTSWFSHFKETDPLPAMLCHSAVMLPQRRDGTLILWIWLMGLASWVSQMTCIPTPLSGLWMAFTVWYLTFHYLFTSVDYKIKDYWTLVET